MKAKFEVRTIKSSWKPPFKKDITDDVFTVEENEQFDRVKGNGNDENVYHLIRISGDRAIIKYSKLFTLKVPNPGDQQLILEKDKPVDMTYMWGEDGTTKKITYKGITAETEQIQQ
jgi:hypothetical protein